MTNQSKTNDEVMRMTLDALEKLRAAILCMRDNSEEYGRTWARCYAPNADDFPGSAHERFTLLGMLHDRMKSVPDSLTSSYDAIAALKEALNQ